MSLSSALKRIWGKIKLRKTEGGTEEADHTHERQRERERERERGEERES